ncbi:hypothetical protein A5881_003613 [Enterococcus termitis]
MRAILLQKNFKNYGFSISIGTLAASLLSLAVYWYVLETTESVTALAVTGFVQSLPAIFSLLVSKYADKYNPQIIMVFSDLLRGTMTVLILLNIFTFKSIAIIIVLNMLVEFAELTHTSSTTSIIPSLVSDKNIEKGVGTSNAIISISELIGVGLGGVLYETFGSTFLFAAVIVLFCIAVFYGLRIQFKNELINSAEIKENQDEQDTDVLGEKEKISGTLHYIKSNRLLLRIILVSLVVNIAFAAFDIVLTVHVYSYLGQGAQVYGLMSGALMAGMILGSILIGNIAQRLSISKIVLFGFIITGTLLILLGLISIWVISLFLTFCIGLFMALIDSSIDSWCLRIIPESIRGSVLNMLTAMFSISLPAGSALFGFLLGIMNSTYLFMIMGAIVLIGIILFTITGKKLVKEY